MNRINLLQMINSSQWGGGEAHLLSLVRHFSRSGFCVYAAFPQRGPLVEAVEGCGAQALLLNWRGASFPMAVTKLIGLLREKEVHLVHSHDTRTNLLGRMAGKCAGVKAIVSTYHMPVSSIADMGRLKKTAYCLPDRLTFPLCHGAIAVSDAVRRQLIADGYPHPWRISVIHNGVDPSRFDATRPARGMLDELGISPGAPIIGTVARLSHEKSQATLIRAMLRVRSSFPRARCLIVGEGPLHERLKGLAADLGLGDHCIFTGHRQDVAGLLSVMDLFVLPSLTEGFPTSLLEAMAAGKAVVATRVGGVPEIVEQDRTGLLVKAGDEKGLADAVVRLLCDEDARRAMGLAGRRRVMEKFELNAAMEKIGKLYSQLLADGSPGDGRASAGGMR